MEQEVQTRQQKKRWDSAMNSLDPKLYDIRNDESPLPEILLLGVVGPWNNVEGQVGVCNVQKTTENYFPLPRVKVPSASMRGG